MKKPTEYHATKIRPIIQLVANIVKKDPSIADNPNYLWACLVQSAPELKDRTRCANCGASMAIYTYSVTILDTRLLCALADIITKRMQRGMAFTDANKIHMPSELKSYNLISRQTISSKLGLIAKVMKKDKSGELIHDQKAGWSITRRGFDFLKGKPIPRTVKVFHNRIQERFEDQITIGQTYAMSNNRNEEKALSEIVGVFVLSLIPI